jgi:hypothetical protein
MSSLLTDTTRALGLSDGGDNARMVVGVVAIGALLAVLLMREMARAELAGERARRVEHVRFVTVPLSLVFVAVVVPRIVELLT